jgi:hypothetical protein
MRRKTVVSTATKDGFARMVTSAANGGSRMKLFLLLSVSVVFCLCILFATKYTMLKLRVDFAAGQVAIFEEMKTAAGGTTDPHKLSGQLQYVVNYYPSGSKQVSGASLDKVVETARSNAVAAIIAHLRATTGKDLGSVPETWFNEYAPK